MFRVNNSLIKLCLKFVVCKSLPIGSSSNVKCGPKYIDSVGSHEFVKFLSIIVFEEPLNGSISRFGKIAACQLAVQNSITYHL
jgi:hypothetical protein